MRMGFASNRAAWAQFPGNYSEFQLPRNFLEPKVTASGEPGSLV
jgi:hypothetical protein